MRRPIATARHAKRRARALVSTPGRAPSESGGQLVIAGLAVAATLVHPLLGLGVAMAPGVVLHLRARRERRDHAAAVVTAMPEVIDLFRVAAGSGATVYESVVEVSSVGAGPVTDVLATVVRRTSRGERLAVSLPLIVDELGDAARPLVAALVSCERDGTELSGPLERAAFVARDVRRREAETAARQVPVRLVLPLVLCTLPAFALLTVVPLLAGTLRSLRT
jgi:tight adherence protein C